MTWNTTTSAKYRIQTTMGCGWQSWRETDDVTEAADLTHVARRTGYRARILNRRGEELHVAYDRNGAAHLVMVLS